MSQQRIIRAADDVDYIAKRLKEIEAERAAAIAETELPCDVEPVGMSDGAIYAQYSRSIDRTWQGDGGAALNQAVASIYNQEFWQPLIDAGILELVEPGDA